MTHTHLVWGVLGKDSEKFLGNFIVTWHVRLGWSSKMWVGLGILNLHRSLLVVYESLRIVNVQLTQVQLTCSWNIQLHLSVITSNKENLQRCIWAWFCLPMELHMMFEKHWGPPSCIKTWQPLGCSKLGSHWVLIEPRGHQIAYGPRRRNQTNKHLRQHWVGFKLEGH